MIGTARQPVKVAAPKWNRKGEFAGEPELSARLGLPRNRRLEWRVVNQEVIRGSPVLRAIVPSGDSRGLTCNPRVISVIAS